jgi:Sec-independent protein secretion pathway component TatC
MGLLFLSALITPPDVFSLLLTTIPVIILFEIATFIEVIKRNY